MVRSIILAAAVSIAATSPIIAADQAQQKSVLEATAAQTEARNHLIRQGYSNISDLQKDENGRWTATAVKDGKVRIVAIDIRRQKSDSATQ